MCCKGTKKKWTDQIVVSLLFHLFFEEMCVLSTICNLNISKRVLVCQKRSFYVDINQKKRPFLIKKLAVFRESSYLCTVERLK